METKRASSYLSSKRVKKILMQLDNKWQHFSEKRKLQRTNINFAVHLTVGSQIVTSPGIYFQQVYIVDNGIKYIVTKLNNNYCVFFMTPNCLADHEKLKSTPLTRLPIEKLFLTIDKE